jgi:hypothetical protein
MNNQIGSISVTDPNHGGQYVCAVKINISKEGLFCIIDLGPNEARAIALQLLTCTGDLKLGDIAHEASRCT